jgi:serine/threonine-protein kinase PknG
MVLRDALAHGLIELTAEVQLALARALIELGRHGEAESCLAQLEAADRREWRGHWHRGLSLAAQGRAAEAGLAFDLVYGELPGELAPKLAMALAAELAGDLQAAAHQYDIVSSTDPGFMSASFGLARVRQAQGDAAGAAEAYERVPPGSSLHANAQIALARALIQGGRSGPPSADDLVRASSAIARQQLGEQPRAELAVQLYEAALTLIGSTQRSRLPDVRLLDETPLREVPVRFALERAYRELAWTAAGDLKLDLVECANEVRPMTAL